MSRLPLAPGLLLATVLLLCTRPAAAQPIDWWMVLPYGEADAAGPEQRAAEQVVQALKDRRIPVLSMHQARDAFEKTSREPKALDPTDIDLLAEEAYEAVRQVAFGNRQAAARRVSQVMQRAERAMETLNRETKNARYVLDACLALVRSTMSRGDRESALAEAMRCRRIVPDVTPSELMHPPSVIGVLAEADDKLRRMQIGQLSVESTPEAGCSVYLNGRHLGTTPFKLRRAAAGEYRVQVECGERAGRVHTVQLGEEPVNQRVDTVYDQAIRSQPALELRYEPGSRHRDRLIADALRTAEITGAYEAVLVSSPDPQHIRLQRVTQGQDRVLADVRVALDAGDVDADSLQAGLDDLIAGRLDTAPGDEPVAEAPVASPPKKKRVVTAVQGTSVAVNEERADWTPRQKQLRIGVPLVAAGTGLLAAGWALYADARQKQERRDALNIQDVRDSRSATGEYTTRAAAYESARKKPAIAFAGGAIAAAAMPWLLPEEQSLPPYAWVAGAAGVGLAAVGFWQLSGQNTCTIPVAGGCLRRDDHLPLMSVTFATALPLLAVPLTYALRMPFAHADRAQAHVTASPTRAGATLSLFGSF